MKSDDPSYSAVRVGDVRGLGSVYDRGGDLIALPGEEILGIGSGWDMNVSSPWRRVLPKVIFLGFNTKAFSKLYITSKRIVLIREIDEWREVAGEMTALGMPTAIAKQVRLKEVKASGIRTFCELRPDMLHTVSLRKSRKSESWIGLRLVDSAGHRYAVSFWTTSGRDPETLSLLESRFGR